MSAPPTLPPGTLPPIPDNVEDVIGAQLIGALFNFTLYGILVVQSYVYRLSFPNDNPKIKALVYFVLAFETAQTIMNGVDVFNNYARGFGNLLIISNPYLGSVYTPIMGSIMSMIVQLFFCYRIWLISHMPWLGGGISLVSLLQGLCGLAGGIRATFLTTTVDQSHANGQVKLVYIWLIGDAVADILIAAAMSFFLMRGKTSGSFSSNDVMYRIVRMTVETNALSASVALISVILYVSTASPYFTCPTLIIGKLYANTLLLTFNNRAFLGKNMSSHIESSTLPSYHSQYVSGGKNLPFHAGLNPDTILLTETDTIDLGSHQVNSTAKRLSDATQETGASTAKPGASWK